jgi:hypothetical protein
MECQKRWVRKKRVESDNNNQRTINKSRNIFEKVIVVLVRKLINSTNA